MRASMNIAGGVNVTLLAPRRADKQRVASPFRQTGENQHCPKCGVTETLLLPLSSGHIGRVCGECRMLRHPRPYASKAAYCENNHPMPTIGQKETSCRQNANI